MKFIIVASILFLTHFVYAEDVGLSKAIDDLNSKSTFAGKIGAAGGVSVAIGSGAYVGGELFKNSFKSAIKIGSVGAVVTRVGIALIGGGVVIGLMFPSSADAGTMTSYYMSEKGFASFLKLPKDQQLSYAKTDPDLGDFVIRLSNAIKQIDNLKENKPSKVSSLQIHDWPKPKPVNTAN